MKGKSSICVGDAQGRPVRRAPPRASLCDRQAEPTTGKRGKADDAAKSQNAKREPACAQAAMEGAGRAQGIRETAVDPRPEA